MSVIIITLVSTIIITATMVWSQVTQQGKNTAQPINRKLDLRFTEHGPAHQNKTLSPTVSLSHQEASISLLSSSIRGQTEWKPQSQKLIKLITWTAALSNSMKLWAMAYRATQFGQVMVESSDKMWSTGEGNGKQLQYSCLKNPMNSMKIQKYMTLEDKPPGW